MTDKIRTGLVMEGGAMRGMFTCGVIDVFMEQNIEFDGAIGVSAGAAFGCNYKSRQIGRPFRYNHTYCNDKRYAGLGSFLRTGDLYNADFCYRQLPCELDPWDEKAFRENPMEFYVVCTDVTTGRAVYHRLTDGGERDIQWIRASASMPLVSRVVEIDSFRLLDGGISDSIPLRYMEHRGYGPIVIILTQPEGYIKTRNTLLPLLRVALHRYPNMIRAIANRHHRYNRTIQYIQEAEKSARVLVIRPPEALHIGSRTKDPAELERVYRIGREEGLRSVEQVKAFLAAR